MSHPVNSEPKVRFERWIENEVGWSKPPLVLTIGFNRLKTAPVNMPNCEYESEWSIENIKWSC